MTRVTPIAARPVASPSMGIEILFLILAIVVVAFGIGVVVVSRRKARDRRRHRLVRRGRRPPPPKIDRRDCRRGAPAPAELVEERPVETVEPVSPGVAS